VFVHLGTDVMHGISYLPSATECAHCYGNCSHALTFSIGVAGSRAYVVT